MISLTSPSRPSTGCATEWTRLVEPSGRNDPKIKFEMSALLLDSLAQQAVYADHIFRDNSRLDGLRRYTDFSRNETKQAVYLGRSIHEILTAASHAQLPV